MRTLTIATAALVLAGAHAHADEDEDIAAGADLAKRWCSECHVVGPDVAGGDAGPSFEAVARRPGMSREELKIWLAEPHPPMPDLNLTAADSKVLISYILSLTE